MYINIYNLHIANFKQILPQFRLTSKVTKKKLGNAEFFVKRYYKKKNVFASSGQSMIVCKIAIPGNG